MNNPRKRTAASSFNSGREERSERAKGYQRRDNPERSGKSQSSDRTQRPDNPVWSDRTRRPDSPSGPDRSRRSDRPANSDRPQRSDKPLRQDRPQRQERLRKENEPERLNKYLAECGIASRRKADELIEQGVVKVNGKVVSELGARVNVGDDVTVNGDPVSKAQNLVYILLNKPKDYITTTHDELGRKTVFDIVKKRARLFPVGRLDRNTTGVLLLTNDGELANRMTNPRYRTKRVYHVTLDKPLQVSHARQVAEGVELEDGVTAPTEVFIFPDEPSKVRITLIEGKNREIRRIFESLGYMVKKLDRKEYSILNAKGLNRGEYRHLTRKEVELLKKSIKLL